MTTHEMLKKLRDAVMNTPALDSSPDWTELIEEADKVLENDTPPKVVIVCEGGLVQHVLTDRPAKVRIIDYDCEGADPDDVTKIPQGDLGASDAYVNDFEPELNPECVDELMAPGGAS